jgi:DNA-binding IscR family transcriptional regulator
MLELDAVDSDRRRPIEEIAPRALGPQADANALKLVLAELRARGLTQAKTGRGGGCWLTDKGRRRAERLAETR